MATLRESGHYAIAGFVYQLLGSGIAAFEIYEGPQGDGPTEVLLVERFGQDAAVLPVDGGGKKPRLIQYKYSGKDDPVVPSDLRKILQAFLTSVDSQDWEIDQVDFELVTNRPYSPDTEAWVAAKTATGPKLEKLIRGSSNSTVPDVDKLASIFRTLRRKEVTEAVLNDEIGKTGAGFGMLAGEIEEGVDRLVGLLMRRAGGSGSRIVRPVEIHKAFVGYDSACPLLSQESIQRRIRDATDFKRQRTDGLSGPSETKIRSGGMAYAPFRDIKRPEGGNFYAYAGESGEREASFRPSYGGEMWMRWFDFSNLQGGLSCWERFWGSSSDDLPGAPFCTFRTELDEFENCLDIGWLHAPKIPPGGTWESREYVWTPHQGGWARGIEPFRQWVQKSRNREFSLPDHVRNGLGFRSLFLCNWQPKDGDRDMIWRFSDLPKLAEEAKQYGLTEMVPWFWHEDFQLPLRPAFAHLGGQSEWLKAVAECRKAGVNVAPFISVLDLANPSAARYGLEVSGTWTYHPELLPRIAASYATGHNTGKVDSGNEAWQEEVLSGCQRLADEGVPSICWDVFRTRRQEPNLLTLTRKIRAYARQKDPQSTFAAEAVSNVELMSELVDYTWNWIPTYVDYRAFNAAFDAPRLNLNINHSIADASLGFMDNIYLNVMPRKTPYGVNGSGTIGQYLEFAARLRQCAERRAQFLDYFTSGTLVGECLLSHDCPDAHVTGYVRPGKALLLILNQSDRRAVPFQCNLAPWLPSPSGRYQVDSFNMDGHRQKTFATSADWEGVTEELEKHGIALFEIAAK